MIKLRNLLLENLDTPNGKDWLFRHNAQFDEKNRVIAYHGTSSSKTRQIKSSGVFRAGSYFTLNPKYAKHWGNIIFKVYLPLNYIDFVASDLIATSDIPLEKVI